MSPLTQTLTTTLASILAIMLVLWLVGTVRRDVSIVDPFWGSGFIVVAWIACGMNAPVTLCGWLSAGLTTAWGCRLSLHLLWRNWGHGEDRRYVAMRNHHGARFWWISLLTVFVLQGVILWFVSFPVQVAVVSKVPNSVHWLDVIGMVVWGVGFVFESVGDWQLVRFQSDRSNAGRVMDRGLWRFTRHPNYFGDFCIWWGLYLVASAGGAVWTIASPLVMSVLLLKVSGVSLLESTIVERRPDYAAYKSRTSAFFPWFPKARAD